jgi:hypothetical protein
VWQEDGEVEEILQQRVFSAFYLPDSNIRHQLFSPFILRTLVIQLLQCGDRLLINRPDCNYIIVMVATP